MDDGHMVPVRYLLFPYYSRYGSNRLVNAACWNHTFFSTVVHRGMTFDSECIRNHERQMLVLSPCVPCKTGICDFRVIFTKPWTDGRKRGF